MGTSMLRAPHGMAVALAVLATASTGCTVVEGIFKAGVWVGVVAVVALVGVAGLVFAALR